MFAGEQTFPLIVGYSAKEQGSTSPAGIITFQWDSCNGDSVLLNSGMIVPSVTTINSYEGQTMIPNWYQNAPKIQIRRPDGGYTTLYYCADAYNNDTDKTTAGWADEFGNLDTVTVLSLGQGAWVSCASADCAFTMSGAIANEETAVGGDSTIMMLCGGAFPVSFKVNDSDAVTWTLTPGQSYDDGTMIKNWHLNAPQIQIRRVDGGYTTLYYCSDAYNNDTDKTTAGWADEFGNLDIEASVAVGGGFWLKQPNGDKEIYVTVRNPVNK